MSGHKVLVIAFSRVETVQILHTGGDRASEDMLCVELANITVGLAALVGV